MAHTENDVRSMKPKGVFPSPDKEKLDTPQIIQRKENKICSVTEDKHRSFYDWLSVCMCEITWVEKSFKSKFYNLIYIE